MVGDLRVAVRGLARTPVVGVGMILSLAVGIGVNASAFMGINALTLNPLPFPHLDRIMTLWESATGRIDRDPLAPANFLDWQEQSRAFEHMAAARSWFVVLTGGGSPEPLRGVSVTPEFFAVLGVGPQIGRDFSAEDGEIGATRTVVVSDGFWRGRLAGSPAVLGSVLALNSTPYVVIGVMPPHFDFPIGTDVWEPLALTSVEKTDRTSPDLMGFGLLKPGVTILQARTEASAIGSGLAARYPATNAARRLALRTLRQMINSVTDRFTVVLFVTAAFVLLLASANVAALLLARSTVRAKEYAVRAALGSSKWRLAREIGRDTSELQSPY